MYGFVERRLAEEAAKGAFDNLPNAGKPLDLSENPWLDPEWRMAFKVLKDNQILPEFVERRKEIEQIYGEMRRPHGRAEHRRLLERLAGAIEALNRALVRENQFVRGSLQLAPVDVEAEMRAFDSA
jgi:hypothetical protein